MARWSGWGALPEVFDEDSPRYRAERNEVRRLLGDDTAWARARRTTLNAHYTSAPVVEAMWSAARALGLTGGRVLEPGCGAGNFLGFAPDGAELVGVELDPTTAEVARHLYGARATVHAGPFEQLAEPDGAFDLVIGNVPFAKVTPHDSRYNRGRHSLHNYFLVKSLHLTRPGGLVLALTSRYTLDARNPVARREISGLADLVGAVRFPAGAFAAVAGTKVVEDLLVLRRRPAAAEPDGPEWTTAVPAELAGLDEPEGLDEPLLVNEYLTDHPEMILGRLAVGRGLYRQHEVTVDADGPVDDQLAAALDRLVVSARTRRATFTPAPPSPERTRVIRPEATGEWDTRFAQEGSFVVSRAGMVGRYRNGAVTPYRPRVAKDAAELRRLIGLRDVAREVLALQVANAPDEEVRAGQEVLAGRYEDYVRLYGPLNRYTVSRSSRRRDQSAWPGGGVGSGSAETGVETDRAGPAGADEVDGDGRDDATGHRVRPRMGGFRTEDPDWALVAALEDFDDATQAARPAAIFTERVIQPPVERLGVDTAQEAVAVCLDESGKVTRARVAELLGVSVTQAEAELAGAAFEDPETHELVAAPLYLSGDVRQKLGVASEAAAHDPKWAANVEALEQAMPRQLEAGEITARLGAPWIGTEYIELFCDQILKARVDVEHLPEMGRWNVKLRDGRSAVTLHSEWGTSRASAVTLLDDALNQRLHTVTDPDPDSKRRIRNDAETLAAREKQEALGERFSTWVWENPTRAEPLAERYNELFRSNVLPTYDGSQMSLPGLSSTFTPRAHQRDAVARIVTEGRALLAHVVGAGKTATMVMAAMELRRLGAVTKPAVVVPNHMLEQFSREWLQLYPTARLLVASRELMSKARRKEFVARCATGEWDGVIFTQSGFAHLPTSRALKAAYLDEQIRVAYGALERSKDQKGLSVKKLEKRIAQMESTHEALLADHKKDDGVRWEETGIDYVFVDEAHSYKNRRVDTLIEDVAVAGSQRAEDLDAKLWGLRRSRGARVVTFATATPVANAIAELWVMQSYLHPDLLDRLDLGAFDAWAATFARTHTALELAPDGSSYRMKTRLARYQNVPELLGLYRQVADVRTRDDLDLPTPAIAGGKPETVIVPPSDALVRYVADLARRAEEVRARAIPPWEDNMLKVTGDGRRAALDIRLVGLPPDPDGGKVAAAAREIASIHATHRETTYRDESGEPATRPGALQLVFCDVSTPAGEGWNAYDELREQLVRRGVPRSQIRYMQGASSDDAKAALFAACRDGSVAVLIGSTATMGVGTNVQARLVALHHLDPPWRPADIEQRDGRGVRQGNQNASVRVIRYVTEGSFDTYMWQTLQRKAEFISQVTRGDVAERDVDDIGDEALSFAEVKALASGNPIILEKAGVDNEVARLARLERSWHNEQHRLRRTVAAAQHWGDNTRRQIERLTAAIDAAVDTTGECFAMTVESESYSVRAEAGTHLKSVMARRLTAVRAVRTPEPQPIATLGGFTVRAATITAIEREVRLTIPEADVDRRYVANELNQIDPSRLIQGLESDIRSLPRRRGRARQALTDRTAEAEEAAALLGRPWEHAERFARLRRRQQELDELLTETDDRPAPEGPGSALDRTDGLSAVPKEPPDTGPSLSR